MLAFTASNYAVRPSIEAVLALYVPQHHRVCATLWSSSILPTQLYSSDSLILLPIPQANGPANLLGSPRCMHDTIEPQPTLPISTFPSRSSLCQSEIRKESAITLKKNCCTTISMNFFSQTKDNSALGAYLKSPLRTFISPCALVAVYPTSFSGSPA